jgi:hypothetical protein
MLPDPGIDDVKKQRNAEYAKHINNSVISSLKMEGIRLLILSLNSCHASSTTSRLYCQLVACEFRGLERLNGKATCHLHIVKYKAISNYRLCGKTQN